MTRRLFLLAVATAVVLTTGPTAFALFSDSLAIGSNSFTTEVLDPPGDVAATAGCTLDLIPSPKVDVTWTAPATPTDAYAVYRSTTSGGPYSLLDTLDVSLLSELLYTDLSVEVGVTYYYVLRSQFEGWSSVDSLEASATVLSC